MTSVHAVTKIVPPSRSHLLLHRPRLVDFLNQHIQRRLVLVSASIGYGKTALLTDFAAETRLPVCWYTLETTDRDPQVFLDYLIAAVQRRFPHVGDNARSVLSSGRSSWEAAVSAWTAEVQDQIADPFILVLDDYHTVADADGIHRIVDALLFSLPANAHFVISTRALPAQLGLGRLAVRQDLSALQVDDLKFTVEELQALVRQNFQIELAPAQAAEVIERTEGWIAGILLTARGVTPRVFATNDRGPGADEALFRFLATEAFAGLAADLRQFLLDSSIFDQFGIAVCRAVLGLHNSAEWLQRVQDENLFVVRLDGASDGPRYRYHHLFREFLRQHLQETDRPRWRELNHRAAQFYEQRGASPEESIPHLLAAEMFSEAVHALAQIAQPTFDSGQYTRLATWIDALPPSLLDANPNLLVTRGMVYAETGECAKAEAAYRQALGIYQRRGDSASTAKMTVWLAMLWQFEGRYREAIQACQRVMPTLRASKARWEEARAHRVLGSSLLRLGAFPICVQELEKALRLYEKLGDELRAAWLHHDIGTSLRTHGVPRADLHYQKALAFWRRTHNLVGLAMTLNSIGVGHHLAGDYERAIAALEESRAYGRRIGNRRGEAFALASLGDVYRDRREFARAVDLYRQAADVGQSADGFISVYALTALSEAHRLLGDSLQADRWLDQALAEARRHGSNHEIGLAETALGIHEAEKGQLNAALTHLAHAVELLKPMPRDWARARLHLARAYFLARKYRAARRELEALVGKEGLEAISIPFLSADRELVLPLLRYAAKHHIGRRYFRTALERLEAANRPTRTRASARPRLSVCAFGPTRVMLGDQLITRDAWSTDSAKDLFFLLLANPQGLRRDQILEALWSDRPAANAMMLFHSTAYRLRRTIPRCLVYESGVYHLRSDVGLESDVARFEELLHRAEITAVETERIETLTAALALYRGDYFEESYRDWSIEIRARLRRKYLEALLMLARLHERRGEFSQAQHSYETLLDQDPDREEVYAALMRLQYQAGHRVAAVRTYQRWLQVLKHELGIPTPSREIRELYDHIVNDAESGNQDTAARGDDAETR